MSFDSADRVYRGSTEGQKIVRFRCLFLPPFARPFLRLQIRVGLGFGMDKDVGPVLVVKIRLDRVTKTVCLDAVSQTLLTLAILWYVVCVGLSHVPDTWPEPANDVRVEVPAAIEPLFGTALGMLPAFVGARVTVPPSMVLVEP